MTPGLKSVIDDFTVILRMHQQHGTVPLHRRVHDAHTLVLQRSVLSASLPTTSHQGASDPVC